MLGRSTEDVAVTGSFRRVRGRPQARERLRVVRAAKDEAYVCAINVEEIARGLLPRECDSAQTKAG